ncbi:hypothetical protein ACIBIZ_46890 [Nonomuraea spiralis]|uniref:hypothetical protein n=1 Tax=Nonomuraea TaxID=83681 RepID=UPI000F7937EF|nr:hypothetical protein [Nonomuraea sp. WAC 01424]RSM96165.1 hypothetical protein DMB42_48395 [Nonomuraea sp. WAC 01424]
MMRQRWLFLVAGLALCALPPAVPSLTTPLAYMARETLIDPPADPAGERLVEDTFYLTQGISVSQWLLPVAKGVTFRAGYVAVGVRIDAGGHLTGTPSRVGTFIAPVRICAGESCEEQLITLVVFGNVPWEPRELTFPGRVGATINGEIGVNGGPQGVTPTFTVTDHAKLPGGVSIGPDGHVGGVPEAAGISEVPVRICVAGNCAGVVVRLIIV